MRRFVTAILAALMLLPLCGCGPDEEACLHNAEVFVQAQNKQLREDGNYKYWWEYDGASEYSIVMMVDESDIDEIYDNTRRELGENSSYTELAVKAYLRVLDNQTDLINLNLAYMKKGVEGLLGETDINVGVYYMNIDGEITISG